MFDLMLKLLAYILYARYKYDKDMYGSIDYRIRYWMDSNKIIKLIKVTQDVIELVNKLKLLKQYICSTSFGNLQDCGINLIITYYLIC